MSKKYLQSDNPDYTYFNLRIDNIYDNVPQSTGVVDPNYQRPAPKRANIRLKTGEILSRQSNYKFSIDFFNIRPNMPLFFFEILEGLNTDANAGIYGICLTHVASGDNFPQRVIYVPEQSTAALAGAGIPRAPIDNNGLQDFETNNYYYAEWTFQHMVEMINTAYYNAWVAMVAAHPLPASPSCPPYVIYDEPSGRICMIFNHDYVRAPLAEIFHNTQLENFLEALRVEEQREYITGDPTNFKELRFVTSLARPYQLSPTGAFGLPAMADLITAPVIGDLPYLPWKNVGNEFYVMMQEYDARYFWNNIRSIVFFSSSIAVRPQFLPQPNNPNQIRSSRVVSLSIASPSLCTTLGAHGFNNGDTVYLFAGSYSIDGVPVAANSVLEFIAQNVTTTTFQLFQTNGTTPINVTAFAAIPQMWAYKKLSGNVGQFNSPSRSILAYFDIITNGGVDWRQNLFDNPNYRKWMDLTDDTALTGVDIDVYLELDNGTLIPLTIETGNSIDIKFVFKRKGVSD